MFGGQFRNRNVFLTGHTGFKGSWLCQWLLSLGANVTGYSDRVYPAPDLFSAMRFSEPAAGQGRFRHIIGDVRDKAALRAALQEAQPDFVFHLAAQALVRLSYAEPAETFDVNVMGTVNVLDLIREMDKRVTVIIVTSDKCYENREWVHSYREEDPMGGYDPYSASKGAAELVVSSYRRSFFGPASAVSLASARAGNVIGGGDWAADRIVPDCIRFLSGGKPVLVRRPASVRPWQHVLEPLSGYLWLAARLSADRTLAGGYNFGPELGSSRNVAALVTELLRHWPGEWIDGSNPGEPHEASLLSLSIDKAHYFLGWKPVWPFAKTIQATVEWYRDVQVSSADAGARTREDIASYTRDAASLGLPWTQESPL